MQLPAAGGTLASQQDACLGAGPAGSGRPQPTAVSDQGEPHAGVKRPSALILPNTELLGITTSLVAKINPVKYVDLGDLLPEGLEWAFVKSTEEKKEEVKSRRSGLPSYQWQTLAFAKYMTIAVFFNPHLAAQLATYMIIAALLAQEVQGQAWLR